MSLYDSTKGVELEPDPVGSSWLVVSTPCEEQEQQARDALGIAGFLY